MSMKRALHLQSGNKAKKLKQNNEKRSSKSKFVGKAPIKKKPFRKTSTQKARPSSRSNGNNEAEQSGEEEEEEEEGEEGEQGQEENENTEETQQINDSEMVQRLMKEDAKEGTHKDDAFYERYVKRVSEADITSQIDSCAAVTNKIALNHSILGSVVASGPVASGQPWAVGMAQHGIENTDWLANDATPEQFPGLRKRVLNAFSTASGEMTSHQKALSALMLTYADIAYHCETAENHQEIIESYILHAYNHIYRARMVSNQNGLLLEKDPGADVADQGFTRPRVLILTPMRNTAYDAVKFLCSLQSGEILRRETFKKRFSATGRPTDTSKPKDHQHYFRGNVDDTFSLGISLKNDMTLCLAETNLYLTDIIVASPAALRVMIGSPGDAKRNFDFLSSIDMLIVDQMDMMLMQNWTYLTLIFDHLNLKPTTLRPGMDFSRTNSWALSNMMGHRRQTIFFSEIPAPDINALFNRKCTNIYGKIRITTPLDDGVIDRVVPQLRQTFQRLECTDDFSELDEQRYKLFAEEIFPHLSSTLISRVVLYIPSYFDYLRIKELFQTEREQSYSIDEYMDPVDIAAACKSFGKRNIKWLLCTERCYYYHRISIPKTRHVVFYAPPLFARFYTELLNPIVSNDATCTVLYTKFEKMQLDRIVGPTRAQKMLASNKSTFLFC